ncbi:IclR family transcriptional regulator [Marinovum sp. 2_MG-2023]|uniref:IclR family transcriptional regulator n=1 Tax=Roseobacteraceae TaxID=2854170 RepID=UPI001FD0EB05|nr:MULTISPECIES: IclR family transcriptional regulator [Roseobacteraceae]MCJ7873971.1 IclR family transcriptional regulator [Phaeobacter sp. J2-8]MDO6730989.1 IclR family transcriptional regulator [Marinovum sp. 2_MG-2023]MDO6780216.1 IclR family transcriptional regulator [Marinovum sp. 1_MG-2023]
MNSAPTGSGTVKKALVVLELVASFERPVKFPEVLEKSEFPRGTLYRLLKTLADEQMLAFNPEDQTYYLGMRLIRLAHTAWKNASLAPIARPFIESLAAEVNETVHLAQIDSGQVLFIDKIRSADRTETLAKAGKVAPAYCTGVGKAMLAFMGHKRLELALHQQAYFKYTPTTHASPDTLIPELEEIRGDGIAYDREEHEQGTISIAAPILSNNGRVLGAVSIATSTVHHSLESLQDFRDALLKTTKEIGAEATSWQFPS